MPVITGEQVRKERKDAKVSLPELAQALGRDYTGLSRIETADKPVPYDLTLKAAVIIAEITEKRAIGAKRFLESVKCREQSNGQSAEA